MGDAAGAVHGLNLETVFERLQTVPEPAEKFGRIHHLPAAQLAAVIDGMGDRGLIGDDGWLSEPGRAVKQRVEALTDDLAARPYESLEPDELDELMATLEPLATLLLAAQD